MSAGRLCIRYNLGASTFLHRNRETFVGKDFNNRFRSGQTAKRRAAVRNSANVSAAINVESRTMEESSGGAVAGRDQRLS
jgi:hypothetical protein